MAKVLNLDSLAKKEQELIIGGEAYKQKQLSVEDFIKLTKRVEVLEKKKEDSMATRMEFLIETILISYPTCSAEILKAQTVENLNSIVEFARDGSLPKELSEDNEAELAGIEVKKD